MLDIRLGNEHQGLSSGAISEVLVETVPRLGELPLAASRELNNVCGRRGQYCPVLLTYLNEVKLVRQKLIILREELNAHN